MKTPSQPNSKPKPITRSPKINAWMISPLLSALIALFCTPAMADTPTDLTGDQITLADSTQLLLECGKIQTDAARLACFDHITQGKRPPNIGTEKQPLDLAKMIKKTVTGDPQIIFAGQTDQSGDPNTWDNLNDAEAQTGQTLEPIPLDWDTKTNQTAKQQPPNQKQTTPLSNDEKTLAKIGVDLDNVDKYTPLSISYDLDKNSERGTWTARPHEPMYILPLFLNMNPNRHPSTETQETVDYTSRQMNIPELKFQISLKSKVAQDLFDTNADLWFGYTQQSHWQIYNSKESRPFRATDYQPEIFVTQPAVADLPFNGKLRMVGAGLIHHSNGQSDPLSRSWNRAYLMGGAEWGKLTVIPRVWLKLDANTKNKSSDNPDISDYMGYGDVKLQYDLGKGQNLASTLRYNPITNKGAIQLDYVYPLKNNINGYMQVFHGYGESIIDYNHKNTAVGFGIMLNDWRGFK